MPSKIEWTDETWNPVTGCTPVSTGCANCYAKRMAQRLANIPTVHYRQRYEGFRVALWPERLEDPIYWRKPRVVFVCSMGDLFHEDVPREFLDQVFYTMQQQAYWHEYVILTKRPIQMCKYLSWRWGEGGVPPQQIHIGVSVEDQATADERIPLLLQCPAAKRFVSYEPALGPVDWGHYFARFRSVVSGLRYTNRKAAGGHETLPGIDGLICGGESGPGARPMHPDWARAARDACAEAGVPFFFKQRGAWSPGYYEKASAYVRWANDGWQPIGWYDAATMCGKQGEQVMSRVGKKKAGRLLDGREHNELAWEMKGAAE